MDGLLVVDKPSGPTSHDVVARARRLLREKRVGHTGTLDPLATGVLPLVVGRATRLARFLSASDKSYEAVIALGCATDTGDATGTPLAGDRPPDGTGGCPPVSRETLERALDAFRGTFFQQPPLFSAKKIGGERSYRLARRTPHTGTGSITGTDPAPRPVAVTTRRLEVVQVEGHRLTVSLDCSTGFYVRSLAHDLGQRLGTGAHLAELRRIRSGEYTLADAVSLDQAERDPGAAASRLIPLAGMLQRLPAIALTADDVRRARNGQDVRLADVENGVGKGFSTGSPKTLPDPFFRLLDPAGDLIGIAEPTDRPGLLHPFVVLG